jgi:hypothetical protein
MGEIRAPATGAQRECREGGERVSTKMGGDEERRWWLYIEVNIPVKI